MGKTVTTYLIDGDPKTTTTERNGDRTAGERQKSN